jgi:glycosyltransferase involved in cell wall biosynthesis
MSSVICTVLNEVKTIETLVGALADQTQKPTEIIIVDGGSTDGTWELLQQYQKQKLPFALKIAQKKGNRSIGRNEAIKMATEEMIAITDAGCEPEKQWLEELEKANGGDTNVVVAGAAKAAPHLTSLQSAMVPYVLVMPNKVNPNTFLPATRSMMMSKSLWQELGGFDETLSDNEDYAFAKKLETLRDKKIISIVYATHAMVKWQPRKNLQEFATMIYRFARGDAYAGILRPKVVLIFSRYIFWLLFAISTVARNDYKSLMMISAFIFLFYSGWAVYKNSRYVLPRAEAWLPITQYASDFAVMYGTLAGLLKRIRLF